MNRADLPTYMLKYWTLVEPPQSYVPCVKPDQSSDCHSSGTPPMEGSPAHPYKRQERAHLTVPPLSESSTPCFTFVRPHELGFGKRDEQERKTEEEEQLGEGERDWIGVTGLGSTM